MAEGVVSSSTITGSLGPASTTPGGLLIALLTAIPTLLLALVTFVTITLPTWIFSFLSTSLTLTVNMTTLLLILVFVVSTISWLVRYRWLNMYTRLPPNPQRKEPPVEVYPETQEADSKPGLSNYLDEFLSAIKVFGYLERPVFHELTRTMQTRKLIAGETLLLEEEKGFCLVVDGTVQIFVKSKATTDDSVNTGSSSPNAEDENLGSGDQGYQLLTEVKNGAPMSSLFSILSLFTEDVKLRHDGQEENQDLANADAPFLRAGMQRHPSNASAMDSNVASPMVEESPRPGSRRRFSAFGQNSAVPHFSLDNGDDADGEFPPSPSRRRPNPPRLRRIRRQMSAHPDIVARASVDTTIAIIPATAFHRLTRVYPKATAHIVQVILTRLQRVTLATSHSYLGLTTEVLRTEKLMDRYTTYSLPDFLHGEVLERLKDKFRKEQDRVGPEDSSKGIALHNPRARTRRQPNHSLRKDAALARLGTPNKDSPKDRNVSASSLKTMTEITPVKSRDSASVQIDDSRSGVSAGDLLTSSQRRASDSQDSNQSFSQPYQTPRPLTRDLPSPVGHRSYNPFVPPGHQRVQLQRQDSWDEDLVFRDAILTCMMQAIGLGNGKETSKPASSVPQSPRLVSYDSRRQKAVFNNAFGFMDAYDPYPDADTESTASISALSAVGGPSLLEDLKHEVEIVFFPKGSVLVEKGERNPGIYYVIDGFLDVCLSGEDAEQDTNVLGTAPRDDQQDFTRVQTYFDQHRTQDRQAFATSSTRKKSKKHQRRSLFVTKPGGLAGYLGTISSHRSFIDVVAKTDVYVGFLPLAVVEKIVERYPVVLLTLAKRLTTLLPRLILHIDFALEWVQVNAGQVIYNEKEESDAIYIVLNGRLRAIKESDEGKIKVIGEFGQGDSVGELEVLTESARPGTLHAIRDTELAKFPKTLFNSLAMEHPGITIKISKIIAARMRAFMENPLADGQFSSDRTAIQQRATTTTNLRTVTVLPVTSGVPVVEFGHRLLSALNQIGNPDGVTSLNQTAILNHLGRHAFSRMGKLKLSQYLADLEEKYGLVLYVADTNVKSPWTQTCVNQADCILLVGLAEGSPNIGEYERFLLTTKTTARKELVLLHSERYCAPGLTRNWLKNRSWINGSHHHIQMSHRSTTEPAQPQLRRFGTALKQRVQVLQAEIQKYTSRRVRQTPMYSAETPFKSDFHRLARRICGKSVGLVLGGGGARGIAHVGIIRALEEAGIPIDIVGGTSIGSFIGALYAWDADVVPMYGRAKKFAGRMGSMWRFALDLTYPSASYTTGHEFNRGIFKTFGDSQIEDFWLEFYCNTTNITKSKSEIHTSGYVWRYVRASMSLAGLIPPLCDEGNMLLDGGYVDNLTVTHMKSLGADVIFAIDVGAVDDDTPQFYGDSLSGFWAFVNRYNPFSSYANPPTLSEIQARLAYVSSIGAMENSKATPGCRYLRPPIENYGTLEFGKFDEIYEVGYKYGKQYLAQLREQGILPVTEETEEKKNLRRTMAPRRASI
ncbi:hypothetical protein ANO11243_060890 [Dothideomycetidae sp. 11243]|nr:hypothetical protein ANO11243_060890 [fungal sp. No.11243]